MARLVCVFFFFQAEDGIRDLYVTGVQTCALPICAIFANVLGGNLTSALHGLSLPHGLTAASGASPAVLAHLPAAVHTAYVAGYAASLQTVFRVAVPVGAVAFLLSWTLKEVPLRTTTRAPDPADTIAP